MNITDAMHPGVEWVEADTKAIDVAKRMREKDVGAIPVGRRDRLVGMITDRDLTMRVLAASRDASALTAEDVMSRGIIYCRTGETLEDAVRLMEEHKIRRLPVLDDDKRMVGMLSLGDISHKADRELAGEVLRAVAEHHK